MKFIEILGTTSLLLVVSLLSGCGTSLSNNPSNFFNGAVFLSDKNSVGANELFITDSDATSVVKLSGDLQVSASVKSFLVSPNVGFVAYLADQDTVGVNELYFVKNTDDSTLSSGTSKKINVDLVAGQNVTQYQWSPNGLLMAYIADQDTLGTFELYVSDGQNSVVKMSVAANAGDDVIDFKWSPDSKNIAYTAPIAGGAVELHVSKPDGSVTAVQVSQSLTSTAPVDYQWSPLVSSISNFIAYMSDQTSASVDLYTTAVSVMTSTANALANTVKVTDSTTGSVQAFQWPHFNSDFLAYSAVLSATGDVNLFAVTLNTGVVVSLSAVTTGGGVSNDFLWAPNNTLIAYVADQDTVGVFELYTTLVDGVIKGTKVSTTMAGTGVDITEGFIWSLLSNQLIYRADQDTPGVFELYTSTTDAVSATQGQKISGALVTGGNVDSDFKLSPFNNAVSYIADQEVDEVFELYATNLTDNLTVVKVSATLDINRKVFQHDWSSNGSTVFYVADQDTDGVNDIYSNSINGSVSLNLSTSAIAPGISQGALADSAGVTDDLFPL